MLRLREIADDIEVELNKIDGKSCAGGNTEEVSSSQSRLKL